MFYEDPSTSLSRLLFHGQEWSLWQLEFLVFAFVDMLAADYVLAAVVTAVVAQVSQPPLTPSSPPLSPPTRWCRWLGKN